MAKVAWLHSAGRLQGGLILRISNNCLNNSAEAWLVTLRRSVPSLACRLVREANMARSSGCKYSSEQLQKAITALKRYLSVQEAPDLLDVDEFLYVQIALKTSHPSHRKDKPICIPLPNPFHAREDVDICMFVKDDKSGAGHKAAKKKLEKFANKAGVAKVIGTSKLRTKYESYEAKRNLCREYDLFLADDRILPSLPKLIGKSFFKLKKQPIPVDLTVNDWVAQVDKAKSCTTMLLSAGSCMSIKVARSSQSIEEVLANIDAVLRAVAETIPKKWSNVQAVYLKSSDSVALPVYQTLPSESTIAAK